MEALRYSQGATHLTELAHMLCPLCAYPSCQPYWKDKQRSYVHCAQCQLVFVPPSEYLSAEQERAEYALHQNHPDDLGYRRFLGRVFEPLNDCLPAASCGLDFGCGPGPTLSVMLEEAGHRVALYDPFFFPDLPWKHQQYDFITATEVVEHLHTPGIVLQELVSQLKPAGWLAIMTKRVANREAFITWHYKNDPTHVCFFHEDTFHWVANHLHLRLEFYGNDVVLLQRG
jgi:SAM-dependent methyltransferase